MSHAFGGSYVVSGGIGSFADRLARALGLDLAFDEPEEHPGSGQHQCPVDRPEDGQSCIWVHLIPATSGFGEGSHGCWADEARRLESALGEAEESHWARGIGVTFIVLLPALGLFRAPHDALCEMASMAARALIRGKVKDWSRRDSRLVGVVYGGLAGLESMALRPAAELEGRIPMKRLGSFAELAAVVEFLGSPAAGYISGTVVRVDGGWGAYSWMYPVRTL